jgi:fatty acid hydroxylase domain-containing protein 2
MASAALLGQAAALGRPALEAVWGALAARWSPRALAYVVPGALHLAVFWSLGLAVLALDSTGRPALLYRRKLQPTEHLSAGEVARCVRRVLLNQVVFAILPLAAAYRYGSDRVTLALVAKPVPGVLGVLAHLAVYFLLQEVGFYATHRLLHWGPLYRHVHKLHHDYRAPTAIASEYAHPVEFLLSNILPGALGPALLRSHLLVQYTWVAVGIVITLAHHSGYRLPGLVGVLAPDFHDYHHMTFTGNYGTLGLMDWLLGTDRAFRAYQARQRAAAASDAPRAKND